MQRDQRATRSGLAWIVRGGVIGAAIGLSACALVDQFGDRAVDYNLQAESTNNVGILLNVMRSAYRRPLQFSTVTQANGTVTASAEVAFSLPFGAASLPAYGATPSASLSGGPSFTIVNLDTQDFYKGILTPIDPRIIALFPRRGVSKALTLTLLVDSLDFIEDNGEDKPHTSIPIYNNVDAEDRYYSRFRSILTGLLVAGLNVEEKDIVTPIGPPLSDADVKTMNAVADLAAQGIILKKYAVRREGGVATAEGSGLSADELKKLPADWDHFYQMETKPEPSFQLCFDPAAGGVPRSTAPPRTCRNRTSFRSSGSAR
jgi:hypothetical protein